MKALTPVLPSRVASTRRAVSSPVAPPSVSLQAKLPAAVSAEADLPAASGQADFSDTVQLNPALDSAPTTSHQGASASIQSAAAAIGGIAGATLRVLTLNTYFDSRAGVDAIADLIRHTKADLVGLQEVNLTTRQLAEKLGMHYVQQDKRTALLSRFPIEKVSPKKYGVTVTLDNGQKLAFLNAHTTSFPNQPHQLLHLAKGGGPYINTEKQAIWWADVTRGREFRSMVSEADGLGFPAVVTGDFNEPSHLDWTEQAAQAKLHPIKVEWPGSKTLAQAGFQDSYRVLHTDPVTHPGNTWTPTTAPDDPNDHHDRIDFVMYRGSELQPVVSEVVGESKDYADIVIAPYPTDHRGVLTTFQVSPPSEIRPDEA